MSVVLVTVLTALVIAPCRDDAQTVPPPQAIVDSNTVPRISTEQLKGLLETATAIVIDVRTPESFAAGHIVGAINVPLPDVESRARELRDLARGRAVVAYCSCPDEHASIAAGVILIRQGVPGVSALVGGYPAWVKGGGKTGK